jgi:selenide,water dikinase
VRTGGDRRNRDFAEPHVEADDVPDDLLAVAYDPQTSGGLLVTLAAEKALSLQAAFESRKLPLWRIGHVVEGEGVLLR